MKILTLIAIGSSIALLSACGPTNNEEATTPAAEEMAAATTEAVEETTAETPAKAGNSYSHSSSDTQSNRSASDYIKEEAPDLYDNMQDIYDDAIETIEDYDYPDPEPGEKFSDYVKRADPDLYNDMQGIYDSIK